MSLPSSTTSPTNTLAIPDMAITTFWATDDPVIHCMICNKSKLNLIIVMYSEEMYLRVRLHMDSSDLIFKFDGRLCQFCDYVPIH